MQIPTAQELEDMKAGMDPDKTGHIDFPSFFSVLAISLKPVYSEKMLNSAFAHIVGVPESAISDDTVLSRGQLRACMHRLGQVRLSLDDCDDIVREMDRTGRGAVSRADFVQAMQLHC
ncbi:hypothetical protein JKP88DRAFT_255807 [Tribonema minus]|uniref:EF-hand domain-containing protein n=1 Tax=Tribonema minus TaxID=303371 RepID=A0A835YZ87_9STRA|nr:hypothetical protein JKP88DRAFT_255807 [Tribonema minus]